MLPVSQTLGSEARARLERIAAGGPDFVSLGAYGYTARIDDNYAAYCELRSTPEALRALRPAVEALVEGGSPAARIYAALLLRSIDEAAGVAALESMVDALDACGFTTGGCTGGMGGARLGLIALHLLGDRRRSLATLHAQLDALAKIRDRLPLDTDEPLLLPHLDAIAGHSPHQLEQARDRIEAILDGDRPAARVLAALALRMLDPDAGQRALCQLATDRTELWLEAGDNGEVYLTAGEFVRRFIDPGVRPELPPAPPRPDPTLVRAPIAPETRWERFKGWLVSLG